MSTGGIRESWFKPGLRVGLLGGSFNPAHEGHLHISLVALKALALDRVVWLVSPQNPLKTTGDMAPFAARVAGAQKLAGHPALVVSDIEQRLGTRYSADTLSILLRRAPQTRFVWLIGADNLLEFHRWRDWQDIASALPIAVFARPGSMHRVLGAKAAQYLAPWRIDESDAPLLATLTPPAWTLIHNRLHGASSTAIRKAGIFY